MNFEFTVDPSFDFVSSFAEKLHTTVINNKVLIPSNFGEGYVKKVDIEKGFKFVMHHYTLKENFFLKRVQSDEKSDLISIVFNSQEIPTNLPDGKQNAVQFIKTNGSAIQIASASLGTETLFSANRQVYFGVIGITAARLTSLLSLNKLNSVLETILNHETSFFYHENMFVDAQKILKQLSEINDLDELGYLAYRIKILELLYLLFDKLLHRDTERHSAVNKSDLEKLYIIRSSMVTDVSRQPSLGELAKNVGMSETKMKQLFKQVFGDSIYNYYQKIRMEEAAFLLKQAGYSVSEVGYQLGFSNLSHFSRLFEKHHGLTPKKFSFAG